MNDYKVIWRVDKNEGNGIEPYTLFIKEADGEMDAELSAKHYMLDKYPGWMHYSPVSITKM